jgi:hypothetical protein
MREPSRHRDDRPSPPPPQPSIHSNDLFMPRAEDDTDKLWDPVNQEDDDDMLLWDQGGGEVGSISIKIIPLTGYRTSQRLILLIPSKVVSH